MKLIIRVLNDITQRLAGLTLWLEDSILGIRQAAPYADAMEDDKQKEVFLPFIPKII